MKLFMNTSLTAPDMASLFNLVLDMKGRRLTTKWLLNLRLSRHEAIMIRLLKAGRSMEEIADKLNMSVKSLYRKRTVLSERLGAGNFNEACLFIFKTNCWTRLGTIPSFVRSQQKPATRAGSLNGNNSERPAQIGVNRVDAGIRTILSPVTHIQRRSTRQLYAHADITDHHILIHGLSLSNERVAARKRHARRGILIAIGVLPAQ